MVNSNQYFTINKTNVGMGIQNAIATINISPEANTQTEQLVTFLFNTTSAMEINLVSTTCPNCNKVISAQHQGN